MQNQREMRKKIRKCLKLTPSHSFCGRAFTGSPILQSRKKTFFLLDQRASISLQKCVWCVFDACLLCVWCVCLMCVWCVFDYLLCLMCFELALVQLATHSLLVFCFRLVGLMGLMIVCLMWVCCEFVVCLTHFRTPSSWDFHSNMCLFVCVCVCVCVWCVFHLCWCVCVFDVCDTSWCVFDVCLMTVCLMCVCCVFEVCLMCRFDATLPAKFSKTNLFSENLIFWFITRIRMWRTANRHPSTKSQTILKTAKRHVTKKFWLFFSRVGKNRLFFEPFAQNVGSRRKTAERKYENPKILCWIQKKHFFEHFKN